MGKKIIIEEDKSQGTKRTFTASHIMLYIILGIYIIVSLTCVAFIISCIVTEHYEGNAQALVIPVVSLVGTCSCTAVGFYTNKAAKENEIKLSNDKYRMRLEIAKDIFKEYGSTLDDKSIDLLRKLMSDKDVDEMMPTTEPPNASWQQAMPQVQTVPCNNIINDSEEGLG